MKYTNFEGAGRAEDRVIQAVLGLVAQEYSDPGDPHHGDSVQLGQERLALAARELVEAVNALPEGNQPIGWKDKD